MPSHQVGWTLVLHPKTDTMETDAEPGSSHVQVFGEEAPLQCLAKQSHSLMPGMRGSPLSYRERAPPDWFPMQSRWLRLDPDTREPRPKLTLLTPSQEKLQILVSG